MRSQIRSILRSETQYPCQNEAVAESKVKLLQIKLTEAGARYMHQCMHVFSQGHCGECVSTSRLNALTHSWILTTCHHSPINNPKLQFSTHPNIHKNRFAVKPVWFHFQQIAQVFAHDRHMMEFLISALRLCPLRSFSGGQTRKKPSYDRQQQRSAHNKNECYSSNSFYEHVWLPNNSKGFVWRCVCFCAATACVALCTFSSYQMHFRFYFVLSQSLN